MSQPLNKGSLIASVLAGSWRQFTSPLEISIEELDAVGPSLLSSGAAALAWKRVGKSALRASPAALELEQAYRLHSLQSAIHERDIQNVMVLLRRAGLETVVVKGAPLARPHPE